MSETTIRAELAGRLLSFNVSEGDRLEAGQEIALIEAMKMEIPLTSPVGGTVAKLLRQVDDMLSEGEPVLMVRSE
jgi:biotin carboxyl carrier protein